MDRPASAKGSRGFGVRRGSPALGLSLALLSSLAAFPVTGQNASLLRDIRTEGRSFTGDVNFYGMAASSDRLYLVLQLDAGDRDVWVSDGTPEGTERLRDGCPGDCTQQPSLFGALGRTMLWIERDGLGWNQLWRSDGTRPGTYPLTTEGPSSAVSVVRGFFGGALYHVRCRRLNAGTDCDLWRTDGTLAGSHLVDAGPQAIAWIQPAGDRLYYLASDGTAWELWALQRGQGTPVRLRRFAAPLVSAPAGPVEAEGRLFFLAREAEGRELWTSDGSVAGTKALTRLGPDDPVDGELKPVGSRVYFLADDGTAGEELWRSDGTASGTVRLTNLPAETPISSWNPQALARVGDRVAFTVRLAGANGWKLWTTGGTPATTAPLDLPCAGCTLGTTSYLYEARGKAFFYVSEGSRTNLWATDGSAAGSRALIPGCASSSCSITVFRPWKDGLLLFVARGSEQRFWLSDGTPAGTRPWIEFAGEQGGISPQPAELAGRTYFLARGEESTALWTREPDGRTRPVALLGRSAPSSSPDSFFALGDRILFGATDDEDLSRDLWSSAGSSESTFPLNPSNLNLGRAVGTVRAGGLAYFISQDFGSFNLWRTDGTLAGTMLLRQTPSGARLAVAAGGLVSFQGREIWRSDGTPAGTVKVGDLPAALGTIVSVHSAPQGVFLYVSNPAGARELWVSDGTTAGTRLLSSLASPGQSEYGFEITVAGGLIYFLAPDGVWRSDGTVAGTLRVSAREGSGDRFEALSPAPAGAYFFERKQLPDNRLELRLWRTGGTPGSAAELALFPWTGFVPTPLVLAGDGRSFFVIHDGVHGRELWSTDGTPAGTALVEDILPGPLGSDPANLVAVGGAVYFSAGETVHGYELWRSDGTAAGTRLAQDVAPGAASSDPSELTVAGGNLYFSADDGLSGHEPWVLPLAGGTACRPSPIRLCLGGGRYAVEAAWRDHQGNEGGGRAVALTADTGYFWFFDPANVEAVLKVLDGRGVNGHVWVFYGALSDVEYSLTVTDTESGLTHRYTNPAGRLASVADTRSFGPLGASPATGPAVTVAAGRGAPPVPAERRVVARAATGACAPSSSRLCLNGGRYAVEVAWKDFAGATGTGQAVGLTADTGYFWFFDAANVELVLKVLDGNAVNGHRWVFYGALSSVEYTVTVTDTVTGAVSTYRNPSGSLASVADTEAF